MKLRTIAGSMLIFGAISCPTQARALDARDWESNAHAMVNIKTDNPKSEQLSVLRLLFCFGEGIFKDYSECINEVDKYYDDNKNAINFNIQNQWHDIIGYQSQYNNKKGIKAHDYNFQIYFKPRSLSVSDVVGRYGVRGLDSHTNSDFSKTLIYIIKGNEKGITESPISSFIPQDKKREVAVAFYSSDKVYIDKLIVLVRIPNK